MRLNLARTALKPILLIAVVIYILQNNLLACSCTEQQTPTCASINRADAVFLGKIEAIYKISESKNGRSIYVPINSAKPNSPLADLMVLFSVRENYKGAKQQTYETFTNISTSCTYSADKLRRGDEWLIFADYYSKSNSWHWSPGMCSPSSRHTGSDGNLTFFENYSRGKTKETILGNVFEIFSTKGTQNVPVRILGNGFEFSTTTDKNGSYSVEVPQVGAYKIEVRLPLYKLEQNNLYNSSKYNINPNDKETFIEYTADMKPKQCDYAELPVFSQ